MSTRTTVITEILAAKEAAGPEAFLWVHTSGDVILWPSEAASENDNGARAVGRWQVTSAEVDELISTGDADEVA